MVAPVSTPYSYYNVLNPDKPLLPPQSGQNQNSPTTNSNANSNAVSGANSGAPALSSDLLGLLQTFTPGNALSQTVGLLGGASNPLTGSSEVNILSSNYVKAFQSAYKIAAEQAKPAGKNPLVASLESRNAASNAYNKTLLENAKAAVTANNGIIA